MSEETTESGRIRTPISPATWVADEAEPETKEPKATPRPEGTPPKKAA